VVLRKMLALHNRPLGELAAEEGISDAPLCNSRRAAAQNRKIFTEPMVKERCCGWLSR
jgi:hypothetical protein